MHQLKNVNYSKATGGMDMGLAIILIISYDWPILLEIKNGDITL